MRQSKLYTEEFKAEAIRLSNSGEKSVRAVAEDLGISRHTLESWRRQQPQRKRQTKRQPADVAGGTDGGTPRWQSSSGRSSV